MSQSEPTNPAPETQNRLSGRAKFLVDMGPLLVFMAAYFFGDRIAPFIGSLIGRDFSIAEGEEMFLAVGSFLPAFAVAFVYSVWKERRVAPMLAISGVTVGILGSLTLILQNKTFFYMKPTIIYSMFAILLAGGLASGRNFMKTAFDGALHLDDDTWKTLTIRYAGFFVFLAILNEIAWRWLMRDCDTAAALACDGEAKWVQLKVWGFTALNFIFIAFQTPLIAKNMQTDETDSQAP